jgi:hypothetical protein
MLRGRRYHPTYLRRSRSAAQLNVGATERYEGLWRSPFKPNTSALGTRKAARPALGS